MSLPILISSFPSKSKVFILAVILLQVLIPYNLSAQVKLKEHRKLVAASKQNNTALSSRDTLYCSGKARAIIKITQQTAMQISNQAIQSLDTNTTLILVQLISIVNNKGITENYNHFTFPALKRSCDVKTLDLINGAYSTICDNNLINENGLDTMKAEIFVTIKGQLKTINGKKSSLDTIHADKSIIANRNKNAEILVEGEKLAQAGVLIGSFEMQNIPSPKGLLSQFKIFNSVGALICTATVSAYGRQKGVAASWSLLTYKDNRFRSADIVGDDDLIALVSYLIAEGFM